MLKKILGTFGTRIFCALLSFALVILNARCFGREGVGCIGLFVLGISILQILTSFVGGPSLVYLFPRHDRFQLIFLSVTTSTLVNVCGSAFLLFFNKVPQEYASALYVASVCFSLYYVNTMILLSTERIRLYNLLAVLQVGLLALLLLFQLFVLKRQGTRCYTDAYALTFLLMAILSFCLVGKEFRWGHFRGMGLLLKKMLSYGFVIQVANLSQLFNYRLSYYVVDGCLGRSALGLFETGNKLSESVWLLPKSVSTVQYARISNAGDDRAYARKVTLAFFKVTLLCSLLLSLCLLCIPAAWIAAVFGCAFAAVKPLMYVLAAGIVIFSGNIILSHYFSGLGNYKVNTVASLIGLAVTVALLLPMAFFRPFSGMMPFLQSICCVNVCSYTASFLYTLYRFRKDSGAVWKDFLPEKEDVRRMKEEIRKMLYRP